MKDKNKQTEIPEEEIPEATEVTEEEPKAEPVADEWHDRFVRLAADFDNFKKRSKAEKDAVYSNAISDAVSQLLPIIDNLERAVAAVEEGPQRDGVKMVLDQAMKAFEGMNVFPVGAAGDPFDPQIHNAVMHVDDEELGENTVAEVLQKGYRLGDKVVRHAMVKVAN
ncbi:MAG: nucleotide exchange factor GrpE [Clostridia bacterium]|nr:nucleotide exchange factor GrpE [Clostridia bacterium]